jgi:hypothetical protein
LYAATLWRNFEAQARFFAIGGVKVERAMKKCGAEAAWHQRFASTSSVKVG